MKLLIGFTLGLLAQTLTFIQLQGQFKFSWMKENSFIVALMGIPISLLYLGSVKYLVDYFGGELWPSRLMGFSIGAIVFSYMAHFWFQEPFTLKTGICLFLAFCIMLIQLFWK
jgi:hypothetical protein